MSNIIIPQASLFLGIIPALIFLYISLKGYEGYYKDKNIFLSFVIGIIIGFIAAFVQSYTISFIIIYYILLAFFDQLFKTVILNLRRLQEKKETTIYGLSLGLGFGSAFTPFLIWAASSLITIDTTILLIIGLGTIGIILFHAGTGAYIGYGISIGKLFRYVLTAIILQLPFNFIIGMLILYSKPETLNIQILFAISSIVYGLIIFWYATKRVMPQILEKSRRRIKRKKAKNK